LDNEDILLWKVIAAIHTFSGSIMLSALNTAKITNSIMFPVGIFLFLYNLVLIFIWIKSRELKVNILEFKGKKIDVDSRIVVFLITLVTITIFLGLIFTP